MSRLLDIKVGEFTPVEYEEMTDVSERIKAPMDHSISFKNVDGKLYTESSVDGKDLLTISREAEYVALELAKENPQWTVEAYRRHIESEEILTASALPEGAKMLVFSPTPDVVLSGAVNIGGYNLNKKTIMVREWSSREGIIDCRYISIDAGNKRALSAAVVSIGREVPTEQDSEETLATFHTFIDEKRDLGDLVVEAYDLDMERQTGRRHSYGRIGLVHNTKKALDIAMESPIRLREHMQTIARLRTTFYGDELAKKLEEARYNYAAALDQESRGVVVNSNASAGSSARASGDDFSGYCASNLGNNGPESNEDAYNSMFGGKKVTGKCPCCGEITTYDPCDPECGVCGSTAGNDRSAAYFAKKKSEKENQTAEEYTKNRKSMSEYEKAHDLGRKSMAMIKKFVWGAGAFSPVEQAIDYYGRVVAEGEEAQAMYSAYYKIGS